MLNYNNELLFPEGVSYVPLMNVNDFLSASIDKVIETLIIAYVLVFLVVYSGKPLQKPGRRMEVEKDRYDAVSLVTG